MSSRYLRASASLEEQLLLPSTLALMAALGDTETALRMSGMMLNPSTRLVAQAHLGCELRTRAPKQSNDLIREALHSLSVVDSLFGLAYACRGLAILQYFFQCFSDQQLQYLTTWIRRAKEQASQRRIYGPDVVPFLQTALRLLEDSNSRDKDSGIRHLSERLLGRVFPERAWVGERFYRQLSFSSQKGRSGTEDLLRLFYSAQDAFVRRCGRSRDGNHYDPEPTSKRLARRALTRARRNVRKKIFGRAESREMRVSVLLVDSVLRSASAPYQQVLEMEEAALDLADRISWLGLSWVEGDRTLAREALSASRCISESVLFQTRNMQERNRVELLVDLMRHLNQRHPPRGLVAAVSASRSLTEQWESWQCFVRGLRGLFRDSPTSECQTHLQEIIAVVKGMRDIDLRSCTLALIATSCHEYAPALCDELLQQLPSRYRKRDPLPRAKKEAMMATHIHATRISYYEILPALTHHRTVHDVASASGLKPTPSDSMGVARRMLREAFESNLQHAYRKVTEAFPIIVSSATVEELDLLLRHLLELSIADNRIGESIEPS
jgi:hypothetical protein